MLGKIRMVCVFAAAGACFPSLSWAHPGHGATGSGPAHYVLEPVHALSIAAMFAAAIAVGGLAVVWKARRQCG